ncbi:lactonase family protein [Occallatibacter riparius]|uniref:Lactonase family protein n=1 Tax=Occallatibacter riparius TaxID=1002689 RepID=A0A9J7BNH8_9BACT|nr:lactonase family protein [Occallatibacter riparius]UWZ82470.1 lactonase family protein [Occallatibacter riparius]
MAILVTSSGLRFAGSLSVVSALVLCTVGCGSTSPGTKTGGSGGGGNPPPTYVTEYLYAGGYPFIDQYKLSTSTGIPNAPVQMNVKGAPNMAATVPTKFLFAAQNGGHNAAGPAFNAFSINSDGTLTLVAGSPFVLPDPELAGMDPGFMALTPDNSALYVMMPTATWKAFVTGFSVDTATGKLTPLSTKISFGPDSGNASGAGQLVVDPSGHNVYAAIGATDIDDANGHPQAGIAAFSIDPTTKELTQLSGSPYLLPSFSGPGDPVIDPTGHFVYVAVSALNQVQGYTRNTTTGVLTPMPGAAFAAGPFLAGLAMHPSGKFVFVLDYNQIVTYSIDSSTGQLKDISTWTGNGGPGSCSPVPAFVVDPTGTYLYASNAASAICVLQVDQTSGALKLINGAVPAPNGDGLASSMVLVKAQ